MSSLTPEWTIGDLSRRYEVGTGGPETVSSGIGDAGGPSYGLFQMTSLPGGGTVAQFVKGLPAGYARRFTGLVPGRPMFTQAWKHLAAADPSGFAAAQHDFILHTYYQPMAKAVAAAAGVDITVRSHALQDVVWSTAVQHGPGSTIVGDCCRAIRGTASAAPGEGTAYDRVLIQATYAERGRRDAHGALVHFAHDAPATQDAVARRFADECADALRMLAVAVRA